MKNYDAYILSITTIIAVGFGFSSCKDDEPAAKPKLSFSQSTMTVNEGDGTIDVELVLDKGHVLEQGTHDELIARDGLYARFAEEQRLEGDVERAESEPPAAGAA